MNRKYAILLAVATVLFTGGYIFIYNYLNSTDLNISTKNTSEFIVTLSDSQIASSSKQSATVRVPKYSKVSIKFTGKEGYETNTKNVTIGDSPKSVTVDPSYSKERLASLVDNNKPQIDSAISSYQSDISRLYTVTNHTLYHFGEWASVKLVWKGEYGMNTDTLRVILHKNSNGEWDVAAKPSIVFYSKNYPDIPVNILRSVNQP